MTVLTLVSHGLCPYVQRAAIALDEKGVDFNRINVDLDNKPDWFKAISPLGKVPLLMVDEAVIFESAVIVEYLEDTQPNPLHPTDPLKRAEHRAWMEFGSTVLADIWGFYTAPDETSVQAKTRALTDKFVRLEQHLGNGPYFDGARFSLVDAVFAPVFRYFDLFEQIGDFGILDGKPKLASWRYALADRPSVVHAVAPDFQDRLRAFVIARKSQVSQLMLKHAA